MSYDDLPLDVTPSRIPNVTDDDPVDAFWYELEQRCIEANKDTPAGEPRFDITEVEQTASRGYMEVTLRVSPIAEGDDGLVSLYRSLDRLRRAIMTRVIGRS